MAALLSFPLALTDFWDRLTPQSMSFGLTQSLRLVETGGGEILTSDFGTRLWQGAFEGYARRHRDAQPLITRLERLQEAGTSFLVYDRRHPAPGADPSGSQLGTAAVTLGSVAADMRRLTLVGLPAGYELREGDYLSFGYGAPTRFALHRVVTPASADASGDVGPIEVTPRVRPGAAAGAAVSLVKASCKAVIVPGSVEPVSRGRSFTDGLSFSWRQTLR